MLKCLPLLFLHASVALPCTVYWVGGGSSTSWNATANTNWSASSGGANNAAVPTASSDVCFDGNSGTGNAVLTANTTVKSLTFTGYTGTFTHNSSTVLNWTTTAVFGSGMTYTTTFSSSIGSNLQYSGSGSGSLTTNGITMPLLTADGTGTLTLNDTLTAYILRVGNGTTALNGQTVNLLLALQGSNNTNTRVLNLGSSTVNFVGTSLVSPMNVGQFTITGSGFNITNFSVTPGTSKIVFTSSLTGGLGAGLFTGGNLTYNNVEFDVPLSATAIINGSPTFNTLTLGNNNVSLNFQPGQTVTVTSLACLQTTISPRCHFTSANTSQATISSSSNQTLNNVDIEYMTATGGGVFTAGTNAISVSTIGWNFIAVANPSIIVSF